MRDKDKRNLVGLLQLSYKRHRSTDFPGSWIRRRRKRMCPDTSPRVGIRTAYQPRPWEHRAQSSGEAWAFQWCQSPLGDAGWLCVESRREKGLEVIRWKVNSSPVKQLFLHFQDRCLYLKLSTPVPELIFSLLWISPPFPYPNSSKQDTEKQRGQLI